MVGFFATKSSSNELRMCGGRIVSANFRMFASVARGSLKSCAYAWGLRPMYCTKLVGGKANDIIESMATYRRSIIKQRDDQSVSVFVRRRFEVLLDLIHHRLH